MEIAIEDYFDYDEVKSIVKSAIESEARHQVKMKRDLDFERIFNNSAYHIVFTEMDNKVDYDIKQMIENKVLEILNTSGSFGLFRKKDVWEKEDSKAYLYMQEAVENNKEIIEDKVKIELEKLDTEYLQDMIQETVYKILNERLKG